MFILRKITSDWVEMDFSLGENYTVVLKQSSPADFERRVKEMGDEEYVKDTGAYGFISADHGQKAHYLYPKQQNYIMTENGKTFSNLSLK